MLPTLHATIRLVVLNGMREMRVFHQQDPQEEITGPEQDVEEDK